MHAQRNRELAEFVTAHLPPPPARTLEVGCGSGALARALVEAGYEVAAIDPAAPHGPPFLRVTLEELEPSGSFDAVVAALDAGDDLLRPGHLGNSFRMDEARDLDRRQARRGEPVHELGAHGRLEHGRLVLEAVTRAHVA